MKWRSRVRPIVLLLIAVISEALLIESLKSAITEIRASGVLAWIAILLPFNVAGYFVLRFIWHRIRTSPRLAFRFGAKLTAAITFAGLIPTTIFLVVSYKMIADSVDKWADERIEKALTESARAIREIENFHAYSMSDMVTRMALDTELIDALERNRPAESIAPIVIDHNPGEMVALYDRSGKLLFSNPPGLLPEDMTENGFLPPIDLLGLEPTTSDIPIPTGELFVCAMPVLSDDTHEKLGVVMIVRELPFAKSRIEKGRELYQTRASGRYPAMRIVATTLPLIALLILVISLWTSYLITRGFRRSLRALIEGVGQIGRGNLQFQIEIDSRDEFRDLADAINRMKEQIRQGQEELRRAEKMAAWREIAQKLAHEIKNPLTPIQLAAQRIKRRYRSNDPEFPEILAKSVDTIVREVDSLRKLLNDFSELARMPMPVMREVRLANVIEQAIDLCGEMPSEIELNRELDESIVVMGDTDQLRRAFFNLIKNAIESITDRGRIDVRLEKGGSRAIVQIADTGSGISPEIRETLFLPHISAKPGGMGLGLAIVKKTVDDHGGEITVSENTGGQGTIFTIALPLVLPEVHT